MKFAKARMAANGKPQIDIAIPSFGYKNHVAIDQRFGFIRKAVVTHGARHDGSQLREVVTTNNTASDVWADTAYRSKTNEAWLAANGRVSRIHRKKPKGKPRSEALRAANRANINLKCDDHARETQTSGSVRSKPTVNGGAHLVETQRVFGLRSQLSNLPNIVFSIFQIPRQHIGRPPPARTHDGRRVEPCAQ